MSCLFRQQRPAPSRTHARIMGNQGHGRGPFVRSLPSRYLLVTDNPLIYMAGNEVTK